MKWKCKECDSEHLEQLAWCNVNTNRINDWQDSGTVYCWEGWLDAVETNNTGDSGYEIGGEIRLRGEQ